VSPAHDNTQETLPKTLPGVVCVQWVRCGKPNCRCARGRRHLAYYRFWREGGRLCKRYVPHADLERVRAACAFRREALRLLIQSWERWRQLVCKVREAERQ
jgi:hypothetical protein